MSDDANAVSAIGRGLGTVPPTSESPYRALVVDDEEITRYLLSIALEQEGFVCDAADDGSQALLRLQANRYDLVITDLLMPNRHGHALAVDLLATENRPAIVVHTCVDDPRLTKDLLARGVDDIVYKSTAFATVAARAKVLVDKRRDSQGVPRDKSSDGDAADSMTLHDEGDLSAHISRDEVIRRLVDLEEVFPISQTTLDVYRLAIGQDAQPDAIAAAIERDASLAAEVLRTGNSLQYNRSTKRLTDMQEVVLRVGCQRIGEIALAATSRGLVLKQKFPWLNIELAWKRSVAAGIAVEALVAQGHHQRIESGLFLSALMYPLGRILLATLYPRRHKALAAECRQTTEAMSTAEARTFGMLHTEIMAEALSNWGVTKDVTDPLQHALDIFPLVATEVESKRTRLEIVKLAILLSKIAIGSWEPWDTVEYPPTSILRRLRIPSVHEILDLIARQIDELAGPQLTAARPPKGLEPPTTRTVGYWTSSNDSFDFLASVLTAMGIHPMCTDFEAHDVVVVNGVECESMELSGKLKLRSGQTFVFFTSEHKRRQFERFGRVITLPTSFGRLRDTIVSAPTLSAAVEQPAD